MKKERLQKLEWIMKELVTELIFREVEDIENKFWLITVTAIKISTDLSYLDTYISSLRNWEELTKFLAWYAHNIERQIAKKVSIRKIPKLRFRYDPSWEISWNVINTIKNLK